MEQGGEGGGEEAGRFQGIFAKGLGIVEVIQVQVGQDLVLMGNREAEVGLDFPDPARGVHDLGGCGLVADLGDGVLRGA